MNFDEYQKVALKTRVTHPDELMSKTVWVMGVAGEAGEIVEKWKKIVVYKNGVISDDDLAELKKELGDVVWYIAVLADSLGMSFEEVMKLNVNKLADRQKRGVLKGKGDNR